MVFLRVFRPAFLFHLRIQTQFPGIVGQIKYPVPILPLLLMGQPLHTRLHRLFVLLHDAEQFKRKNCR